MFALKQLHKGTAFITFMIAFVVNVAVYGMPLVLSWFTTTPFTLTKFTYLIVVTAGLKMTEIVFNHFWATYNNQFIGCAVKDIQLKYYERIYQMKYQRLNKTHNGFLKKQLDIISSEVEIFCVYIWSTVNGFAISVGIFLFQIYKQDIRLLPICLIFIVLIVLFNIYLGKKNVPAQQKYNDDTSKFNEKYVDFLQNIRTVKRLGAKDYSIETIEDSFTPVKKSMKKVYQLASIRQNGISFFVYFMYILLLINLFFQMKAGADVLPYLIFYATIFNGLSRELVDLSGLFLHWNKLKAADTQLEELIGTDDKIEVLSKWNSIAITNLEFQYTSESNTVITIPNFYIKKGEKVSIMGESGQGKTTFLNIFSKAIEVDEKNYYIDDQPSEKVPNIAYVSQDIDLFNLSVRDNLTLGNKIEEGKLESLLIDAGLMDWVSQLTEGLDTVVGEKGIKLSAGQKQRLNLIRGILLDRDIYILDEPTSNLDSETEKKITDMVYQHLKEKTCLIVTHRPLLKKICTRHYKFVNCQMIEQ